MKSTYLRNKIEQLKGQKLHIEKDIEVKLNSVNKKSRKLKRLEQAREIVKLVGLQTQEQLQIHISDITSLALESVFTDPYKLELEFIERRNKTECDIYFTKNDVFHDPLEASGYGAVDIASFALRIASWSLNRQKTRNTIILDEPFKNLSKEFREAASQMVKEISQKLNIQFIIVTHDPVLASYSDKIFEIDKGKLKKQDK